MADDNVHLYHGSKQIVRPNNKVLSINYDGEVTLDGITYSTHKFKTREYYGTSEGDCHDYRREWMTEGLSIPLSSLGLSGRDIDLSQLSSEDLRCRYTRNSDDSIKRQSMGTGRSASWWTDTFAPDVTDDSKYLLNARSILTTNGARLYNDAAITLLDEHYKSLGWRVPNVDDCVHFCQYYSTAEYGSRPGNTAMYGRVYDSQYPSDQVYPYTTFFMPRDSSSKLSSTAAIIQGSEGSVINCTVRKINDPSGTLYWEWGTIPSTIPSRNQQDYPSGTYGIIRLDGIAGIFVTRCVARISALYSAGPGSPSAVSVPVRLGISVFNIPGGTGKIYDDSVYPPQIVLGWMNRGVDFPNFYEVRLCRAPIKP